MFPIFLSCNGNVRGNRWTLPTTYLSFSSWYSLFAVMTTRTGSKEEFKSIEVELVTTSESEFCLDCRFWSAINCKNLRSLMKAFGQCGGKERLCGRQGCWVLVFFVFRRSFTSNNLAYYPFLLHRYRVLKINMSSFVDIVGKKIIIRKRMPISNFTIFLSTDDLNQSNRFYCITGNAKEQRRQKDHCWYWICGTFLQDLWQAILNKMATLR